MSLTDLYGKLQMSLKFTIRYNQLLRAAFTIPMVRRPYPSVLGVDPTNLCNLKCTFCPTWEMEDRRGFMDLSLVHKIIDEYRRNGWKLWMVHLHNFGEPVLHKDIGTIVKSFKQSKVTRTVQFATNAVVLSEAKIHALIEAKLDGITISVDAVSDEDYARLKGADALRKLKSNVANLMRMKKQMKSRVPHVTVKLIKTTGNEKDWKPFVDAWRGMVDEVTFTAHSNWGGEIHHEGLYDVPTADKRYACHFLWYYPVVAWNGDVYICCATTSDRSIIGNLYQEELGALWSGSKIRAIRAAHLRRSFHELPQCRDCTYWAESRTNLNYFLRS